MEMLAVDTSAGGVTKILNWAVPPGGAVSLETWSVMAGLAAWREIARSRQWVITHQEV
jgi:hypothetical protein